MKSRRPRSAPSSGRHRTPPRPTARSGVDFSASYFRLEDFEDALLNVPGVTPSAGAPFGPGSITDSVDADDGVIDGLGTGGNSFFSGSGGAGINFAFDAAALGALCFCPYY